MATSAPRTMPIGGIFNSTAALIVTCNGELIVGEGGTIPVPFVLLGTAPLGTTPLVILAK